MSVTFRGSLDMKTASAIIPAALLLTVIGCAGHLVTEEAKTRFEQSLGDTTITVYPTFVRTQAGASYDATSAAKVAEFFARNSLARTELVSQKADISAASGKYQNDIFRASLKLFRKHVASAVIETDYALLAEYLISPTPGGGQAVGGIHCYIVDRNGEPVFLVLLNSHDEVFAKAQPKTAAAATAVLMEVLEERIKEHLGD